MRTNTVKKRLLEGKPALGVDVGLGSPLAAEILSRAGFDFVQVDNQHGAWDENSTMLAFRSICMGEAIPVARVQQNDFYAIGSLLDRGAMGIVVPMVEEVQQAEAAVRAVRYPPQGKRSWGPFAAEFHGLDYEQRANDEILLMIQLESKQAAENAEKIMAVEGVDGCWIGPVDLAKSIGLDMSTEQGKKAHETAIMKILDACKKTNKIPGIYATSTTVQNRLEQGFLYVNAGGDIEYINKGAKQVFAELKNWR